MSTEGKRIAIGVFCADWRLHQEGVHINHAVCKYLDVDGVDVIALPGPDSVCVVEDFEAERDILKRWLKLLIGAHKPVSVAFVSHENCAGHPVSNETHDEHTEAMMRHYMNDLDFKGEMVALCAEYEDDAKWGLREIARIAS